MPITIGANISSGRRRRRHYAISPSLHLFLFIGLHLFATSYVDGGSQAASAITTPALQYIPSPLMSANPPSTAAATAGPSSAGPSAGLSNGQSGLERPANGQEQSDMDVDDAGDEAGPSSITIPSTGTSPPPHFPLGISLGVGSVADTRPRVLGIPPRLLPRWRALPLPLLRPLPLPPLSLLAL